MTDKNHGHSSDVQPRSSSHMFDAITKLFEVDGGVFGLSFNPDRDVWMAAIEWGREAPDSDMVAAAAYGIHEVPAVAVELALKEAGV